MCACVSNNEYVISGPDTLVTLGFFKDFFLSKRYFDHSSELFISKLNAKPKQILTPSSEVFDGSLVRLVIVSE